MDIEEFSEKFGDKMAEMKAYLEGGDVRELMGGLAIEHFLYAYNLNCSSFGVRILRCGGADMQGAPLYLYPAY